MKNKMIRFILCLDNRSHIGNDELTKASFLKISDRVKQLKHGHVFKIKNKISQKYMFTHFKHLEDMDNRYITRATPYNCYVPKTNSHSAKTFYYTALTEWNALPSSLKDKMSESMFKDRLKQLLLRMAKEEEEICNYRP